MVENHVRAQIRGARAMLGWSMVNLATAARVSVSTIRRAEDDRAEAVSDYVVASIRGALEAAGVEFLADEGSWTGVRLNAKFKTRPSAQTMTDVALPT